MYKAYGNTTVCTFDTILLYNNMAGYPLVVGLWKIEFLYCTWPSYGTIDSIKGVLILYSFDNSFQ